MRTRTFVFAAIGLLAFVVILALTMPAAFVASQINSSLPSQLAIEDAKGNLWNGEARVRVAPTRSAIVLDRVQWRFKPERLANGQLAFDTTVSTGGVEAQMEIARDGSHWHVRGLAAHGDAGAFASIFPILGTYRFTGPITASSAALDGDGREVYGDLRIEWREAATGLSDVRPLGTYRADWHSDGGTGRVTVTTLGGALRVDGTGTTTAPARLAFSGEARAEADTATALEPLLDLIGPRKPNGARAIEIRLQ